MPMPPEELRNVTAYEIGLMRDAARGLTNAEMAVRRRRTEKAIEKSFERLREKLKHWGGTNKAGLVHWVDTYYEAWLKANDLEPGNRGAAG